MKRYCIAILLVVAGYSAQAETIRGPLDITRSADQVTAQIAQVRRDMADGKTYSEISADKRADVDAALGRISGRLVRADGAVLSPHDQMETLNDQELVNTTLAKAREDSRLVCRRERVVGSNMVTSQCMTVAQRRQRQQDSQQNISTMQRTGKQMD